MTPFELNLQNKLAVEQQRFVNKWLFPWHNINIPSRVVDVEDFRGGRIAIGGVVFEGQVQEVYWRAISRYLTSEVHETFQKWNEETRPYPDDKRLTSLEGTQRLLMQFVGGIIARAKDTDRRLRGRGFPDQVPIYEASREHSHANTEILRLAESHRALMEHAASTAQPSLIQRLEDLGTAYRGTIAIFALICAIIFGLWRAFVG